MGEKFYNNNEDKYSEVKTILKELPQVKASSDFEYNLMTKIRNQNFDLSPSEGPKAKKWIIWTLGPAFTLAFTAVILFFIITPPQPIEENLLLAIPEVIVQETSESYSDVKSEKVNTPVAKKSSSGISDLDLAAEDTYRTVIKPNDVVIKEKILYPFNESRNINLDDFVGETRLRNASTGPLMSVGGGTNAFNFRGFYIPLRQGTKEWNLVKNRMDSLKLRAKEKDLK